MKFALVIIGSPTDSQACHSALDFCQAALAMNHEIYRIFLLDAAAQLAHKNCADGELQNHWQNLQQTHQLDIVVCVNSAHGQHITGDESLAKGFIISGMGQLIDANAQADRLITFGY
jgi:tRNA 2-thiouridine synthesizing protein D